MSPHPCTGHACDGCTTCRGGTCCASTRTAAATATTVANGVSLNILRLAQRADSEASVTLNLRDLLAVGDVAHGDADVPGQDEYGVAHELTPPRRALPQPTRTLTITGSRLRDPVPQEVNK